MENLYKEIEENAEKAKELRTKLKDTLLKYKDQAFLSKTLARVEINVPIDFNLKKCQWKEYDREKITEILKNLEFHSLIERLPGLKKQKSIKKNLKFW